MSIDDRDGKIWMDGQLTNWRAARIHVLTHTLHYGLGIFEGVRAYKTASGTAIFRLADHTRRFLNSAKILQITLPFDESTLLDAQCQVVRVNALESGYIRPFAWLGSEKMGLSPEGTTVHVAIAAWLWGAYMGEEGIHNGIRVKITRATVITLAREHGIEVIEKRITRDEMYCAEEAFFTGTAAEMTPIREIDRRTIGSGRRGPITERLQRAFFEIVAGENPRYMDWLTLV